VPADHADADRAPELLGPRLVDALRHALDAPTLDLAAPVEPLAGGFVNPIYALRLRDAPPAYDRDLVLRVDGRGPGSLRFASEAAIQRFAFDRGYPTAEPLRCELDAAEIGAPYLLMARLDGRPLIDRLLPPGPRTLDAMDLLADLLVELHRLPVEGFPGRPDRAEDYRTDIRESAAGSLPELGPVSAWLDTHAPAPRDVVLAHLDFHPINVMVHPDGSSSGVLDWENAGLADRHMDLADSLGVLTLAPVDGVGSVMQAVIGRARRLLARRFARRYARALPVDRDRLAYYEVLTAARRLRGALLDRPAEPGGEATGFTSPAYITTLRNHIAKQVASSGNPID
jgi:aminoglycoside phosphotransferase (APT) family kinase protein